MAPAAAVAKRAACGERDGALQALVGRRLDQGEHCLSLVERVQLKAVAAAAAMAAAAAAAAMTATSSPP